MPKGLFTQTVCLLLKDSVSLDQIEQLLALTSPAKRIDASNHWSFGGESLVLNFADDLQGRILIDLFEHPWPDTMGNPKSEPMIFAAWSMSNFGPATYPQGLLRAAQHSYYWPSAGQEIPEHRAVLRLRTTYAGDDSDDSPVLPEGYDATAELNTLLDQIVKLSKLPEAICYFNPSGEVVRPLNQISPIVSDSAKEEIPPLDLWTNIRMYGLNPQWSMMDTVGNLQIDLDDIEAIFSTGVYDPNEVAAFLRNITIYLMQTDKEISDGDTLDGPGKIVWNFKISDQSLSEPPRKVLRVSPDDGVEVPEIEQD